MTQKQFSRWLVNQRLTPTQTKMAAILYAVNGYENAKAFIEGIKEPVKR